jgi:type II secretory ATPase GspE/PulE/Tfp pilus assembly ATPase PilB-like protein
MLHRLALRLPRLFFMHRRPALGGAGRLAPGTRPLPARLARLLVPLAALLIVAVAGVSPVLAQGGEHWPKFPLKDEFRGPGFYLSWIKILACWLVFLAWVKTSDWLNEDVQQKRLNYLRWNPIVFGTFIAAFVLVWLIPIFWIGFPLLLVAYIAPLATYIVYRNKRVEEHERVLTPAHLRFCLADMLGSIGINIEAEPRSPHDKGPPVRLAGRGADDDIANNARTMSVRQTPGIHDARKLLSQLLDRRAEGIMLDYGREEVSVKVLIDGVWHSDEPRNREKCDPVLVSLKTVAGLKPEDRKSKQKGPFLINFDGEDLDATLLSQGTTSGERAVIQIERQTSKYERYDEIGMRPKMEEQLKGLLEAERGFIVLSAPQASGLRTTSTVVLERMDRFLREFVAIEDQKRPYQEIENIPVVTYDASAGESPATKLRDVLLQEPEVLVVRDLVNKETLEKLCEEARKNLLVLTTVRAKESVEALARIMSLKMDATQFAKTVTAVLNQRLIRRLCEECKEAYKPPPHVLKQLGVPQGRVEAFYRPPKEPEKVCPACQGVGYVGRTGLFELLVVGKTTRQALAARAKLDVLRQTARKDGMKTMQEEGVLLVVKGITSLEELQRVMKQ